eukprot:scaffold422897_cov86-Attheya_sp.AAC.1
MLPAEKSAKVAQTCAHDTTRHDNLIASATPNNGVLDPGPTVTIKDGGLIVRVLGPMRGRGKHVDVLQAIGHSHVVDLYTTYRRTTQ